MRFRRFGRTGPFLDTPRKRSAASRKQQAERDALPLLAPLTAESQPSIDQVMSDRAELLERIEARDRDWRASKWREARKLIAALPDPERRAVLAAWQMAPYPADPVYLLDYLTQCAGGRIDPFNPPFIFSDAQRQSFIELLGAGERSVYPTKRGNRPLSA